MPPTPQKSKAATEKEIKAAAADAEKKRKKEEDKKRGIKKPLSAYMLYCNLRRPTIMKEMPGKSFQSSFSHSDIKLTEVSKIIGEEWRCLDSNQKNVITPYQFNLFYRTGSRRRKS